MTMTNYDGTLSLYVGTVDTVTGWRARLYAYERYGDSWELVVCFTPLPEFLPRMHAASPADIVRACQKLFAERNLKLGKIAREYLEGKR